MVVLEYEQPKKKPRRITIKCGQRKTTHDITYVEEQPINKSGQTRHAETTETTTTTSLAEFLTCIANDDILFEIFTRLPNARDVLRCAAVCKQWRSVISQPHFVPIFKRHHQKRSPPFTLLLRVGLSDRVVCPRAPTRPPLRELFSEDSKMLHGPERSAGKSEYLEFLPLDSMVRASCEDLLLVELQPESRQMCVCNPLTRQWAPLPLPPLLKESAPAPFHRHNYMELLRPDIHHYALGCDPNSEHHHYTVVVSRKESPQVIRAAVFHSETGRWDEPVRTFILGARLYQLTVAVGTIDGAIYTPLAKYQDLEKISAFDPSDVTTGLGFGEIGLPVGFKRGWRGKIYRCRIGAVRGRLRLWQSYFDKRMGNFVFKVWQLLDKKYDHWVLVHDLRLAMGNESKFSRVSSAVIALHPHDDDVFFFKDDSPSVWEYRIGTGNCQKIGEVDKMWRDSAVYTVVHQPWPTQLPQLLTCFRDLFFI